MTNKSFNLSLFLFYTIMYIGLILLTKMTPLHWIVYIIGWMFCNVLNIADYLRKR
jgi:hypothetical protein